MSNNKQKSKHREQTQEKLQTPTDASAQIHVNLTVGSCRSALSSNLMPCIKGKMERFPDSARNQKNWRSTIIWKCLIPLRWRFLDDIKKMYFFCFIQICIKYSLKGFPCFLAVFAVSLFFIYIYIWDTSRSASYSNKKREMLSNVLWNKQDNVTEKIQVG